MTTTLDLINAIEGGKTLDCENTFADLVQEKVANAMATRATEVRAGMFESEELDEASVESKIASLEKKIKDAQDAQDALRTKRGRAMRGQNPYQGPNEIALQKKIDDLRQQIDDIK